jgi:dephospho-CoA kinase
VGKWVGKFVIGLTGNIGTGKSVVRKMLEHLGAYGIDADALGHRAIAKGAPGYQPVLDTFGRWILTSDGQVDRIKLGKVVFSDPQALSQLEAIVHPLVRQAIDLLVQRSSQRVVVIEAIKLLEAGLSTHCDSIWVTYAPPEIQAARLMENRRMSAEDARMRIIAQPPQEKKIAAAKVVIKNVGTLTDTWKQVSTEWARTVPQGTASPESDANKPRTIEGELSVQRGRPRQSADIANLINRMHRGQKPITSDDIMAAFSEKAYLLLQSGKDLVGAVGWQVENLVARTTDVVLDPAIPPAKALPLLINEMEKASKDLQCEAALVFVSVEMAKLEAIWHSLGYEPSTPQRLGVQAWQEAAKESMPAGSAMFIKVLRTDRVLRPI